MLKSIKYHINSQDTNEYIQLQHKGTKGKVFNFNETNLVNLSGYSFVTWNTQNGVLYNPGTEYIFNQYLDLYAQWEANTYTVRYNANGGTGTIADSSHTCDTEFNLPSNIFTRDGYTFAGWATAPYGKVANFDGQLVSNLAESGVVNLYAQWKPIRYTITNELGGGEVSTETPNPKEYTIEDTPFTLNNPTRTGYIFTGWSGTGITGEPVMEVTIPAGSMGNRSYTAHWTLPFRTLTDTATGISVSGYIRSDAVLTVGSMVLDESGCDACETIRQWMNDDDYVFMLGKDISLSQDYSGTLVITIPVDAQYNGKNVTVLSTVQAVSLIPIPPR